MNSLFQKGREGFLDGSIDWDTDDIRVILVDLDDMAFAKVITAATNATPIVITAASHGYTNGDVVLQFGVGGNTAANGIFKIKNTTTNTYELTDLNDVNVAGNGAYTSGGRVINLTAPDNLDDVAAGGRVAVSGALAGKTVTGGVADANDVTFTSVTGDPCEALIIYKHTGTESTSRLIGVIAGSATGLPVTPNGGDITVAWDSGVNRIFKL